LTLLIRGSGEGDTTVTTSVAAVPTTTTSSPGPTETTSPVGSTTSPVADSTVPTTTLPPLQQIRLEIVAEGIDQPTVITAPADDDRLFVAQRLGVIRILDADRKTLDPAFLDISDRVGANGIEQGLLGLTFHPDYSSNGRFFVYYTDRDGRRQLSEFRVSASDPNLALPETERVLLELEQPAGSVDIRHYAGQLAFGPEGYLWISLGDGADSRDQGQDPNTLFGTVSRIDVDDGDPYGIPPENPFTNGGGAPEVWAYGLRNPWRFSIDPVDRLIYLADVGQSDQEEVDILSIDGGGFNLGWSDVEGTRCFHLSNCDLSDYTSPVITYTHDDGCSVTGGYVYRGSEIPEIDGTYFYSDWCSQWIRSFRYVDGRVTDERDWSGDLGLIGQINSFGQGGDGELYAVTHEGVVARFVADR
jgi:glucose/arabinose dehydrogenase